MNDVAPIKQENPLVKLHEQLEQRTAQFQAALPAHIPAERFKRVLMTAIQQNPKLATADRPTLFTSAMKAAHDGLLPDGREGALVIYNTKIKVGGVDKWVDAVQWMPMIGGIRKKVRNSKEIATWDAKVVYDKDEFIYEDGLDLTLKHKPYLDGPAGEVRAAYSVAKLKSGEVTVDVMPRWQIDRIRNLSKSKDKGPWVDHFAEMAKKTVARRHSKVLPMSTDLDDLLRGDEELYDMDSASDKQANANVRRTQLSDFSDVETSAPTDEKPAPAAPAAAKAGQPETAAHDPETGEIPTPEFSAADAMELGREHRRQNRPRRPPAEWTNDGWTEAYVEGFNAEDAEIAHAQKGKA